MPRLRYVRNMDVLPGQLNTLSELTDEKGHTVREALSGYVELIATEMG